MVEESNSYEIISEDGFSKIKGLDKLTIMEDGKLTTLFGNKNVAGIQNFYRLFTFFVKFSDSLGEEKMIKIASKLNPNPNAYLDSDSVVINDKYNLSIAYAKSVSFLKVKYEDDEIK